MSDQDDIQKQINNHSRRLQKLKEKLALEGISVDPKISLEIEDIEAEIERLQMKLKATKDDMVLETIPAHKQPDEINLGDLSYELFNILLAIPAFRNQDNRDLLLRNLPAGPVESISRSGAPIADLSHIIDVVTSWGRLETQEWGLAILAKNALLLVKGTEPGHQLETWLSKLEMLPPDVSPA